MVLAGGQPAGAQQLADSTRTASAQATWTGMKPGAPVRFWQDRRAPIEARFLALEQGTLRFQLRAPENTHIPDGPPQAVPLATITRVQGKTSAGSARRYASVGVLALGGVVIVANAITCEPGAAPEYCFKRLALDAAVTTAAFVLVRGSEWHDLPLPPPDRTAAR